MTRHRHKSKKTRPAQPGGYPSPAERAHIIERRRQLSMDLIGLLVRQLPTNHPHYRQLIEQHGAQEVSRSLEKYQTSAREHDTLLDTPYAYRKYRQAFAVFGGQRPYLPRAAYLDRQMEFMKLFGRRTMLAAPPYDPPSPRESELCDLILAEHDDWEDITPPAIPPRPREIPAPNLVDYPAELQPLFEVGPSPSPQQAALLVRPPEDWHNHLTDLTRIIFAPDLLNGWPGDRSAWAPLHALNVLAPLRAAETAPFLLKLMDNPDDWLSDLLPRIWARTGPTVSPLLWAIIDQPLYSEDKRAQAVFGLEKLALSQDLSRAVVIEGLVQRLEALRGDTPSLNAYIIVTLRRLQASQAEPLIAGMFQKGWVNERIVTPGEFE
jgi:hypothetical protein